MANGVAVLHAIPDVYVCPEVTVDVYVCPEVTVDVYVCPEVR
jgi:hypothetical protein